jgi:hypothetical protein
LGWAGFVGRYFDKTNRTDSEEPPPYTQSWSDLLHLHPETATWVAPATVFVSHAHSCSFRSLVDGLKQLVADLPPHAPLPFLWLDFLCLDLHLPQNIPQEWWSTTFKHAIQQVGHTVMLLQPWDSPIALTRAWCLWELYATVDIDADFSVCLVPEERKAFETALLKRPRSVLQAFSKIEVERSQASRDVDRQMVLAEVNEQFEDAERQPHYMKVDGGPEGLNALVTAELRDKWVVGSAWALVAMQTGPDGELETAESLEVGRKVASLMGIYFGKWAEAKTLWALVAAGCDTLHGADARPTLQARGQLAQAMRYLNEPSESRALYEDVLLRQTAILDKHGAASPAVPSIYSCCLYLPACPPARLHACLHARMRVRMHAPVRLSAVRFAATCNVADETLLITKQNLANLLRSSLHDFSAARDLEEDVIKGFTALRGPDHDRTLQARGNFALTLDMEGRYQDAKREYEAVLHVQRRRLGPRHPHVLHTQYNLALLVHNRLGDARGGRKLLQEVVTVGEKVLGAGHPHTKKAARALALWGRGW